jgi:hypothetical protein
VHSAAGGVLSVSILPFQQVFPDSNYILCIAYLSQIDFRWRYSCQDRLFRRLFFGLVKGFCCKVMQIFGFLSAKPRPNFFKVFAVLVSIPIL